MGGSALRMSGFLRSRAAAREAAGCSPLPAARLRASRPCARCDRAARFSAPAQDGLQAVLAGVSEVPQWLQRCPRAWGGVVVRRAALCHCQQGLRGAAGLAPPLLPFLQGAHAHAHEPGKPRLRQLRSGASAGHGWLAIRRGSFTSVKQLISRIDQFVTHHNTNCRPFRWTATADLILEKLHRLCSRISGAAH